MKTAQWVVLLGVVTAMVFGITFAVSYLPVFKGGGPKTAPQVRLTFADRETTYPTPLSLQPGDAPQATPPPAEFEMGQERAHDFWFKNENAQDLPVGLQNKTCQCTRVELWLAPKDWTDVPAPEQRAEAADGSSVAATKLPSSVTPTELKEKEGATIVPAGAVGMVRLTWKSDPKNDRSDLKTLGAKLWMGENGPGPLQVFEIRTKIVGPVRVAEEYDERAFTLDDLPQTVHIPCWSATRSELQLEVEQLHNRWKGKDESNPFEIGKPTVMTTEELARIRKDPSLAGRTVMVGYNIPLTLRRRSRDGKTPMDLGPYRVHLALKVEGADPVEATVKGRIHGDLGPVDERAIPVHFEPFDHTQEISRLIEVESGADVTRLELDRERTADFLTVDDDSLKTESDLSGGRKTWSLKVKWVPKSGAVGVFPRDAEGYRDSAIYIRPVYATPKAEPPPCLCIPVVGKADTRE